MAAGDVTFTRYPYPVGNAYMVEGYLEADDAGTDVTIGGTQIIHCLLTARDTSEASATVWPNYSDGGTTQANGHVYVSHSGSGADVFNFRITFLM